MAHDLHKMSLVAVDERERQTEVLDSCRRSNRRRRFSHGMSDKPTVFIGSSAEGLEIARFLHAHLEQDFRPRIWEHGLFVPGNYALDDLQEAARSHDFAILCATPDDVLIKRGKRSATMRDNVLLELGLFMGARDRRSAFLLVPRGKKRVALPTDLLGLTYVDYDAERFASGEPPEQHAALASAALKLKTAMLKAWTQRNANRAQALQEGATQVKKRSVQRLYSMIVDLRDLLITLPVQVLDALPTPARFHEVKNQGAERVTRIAESFASDAKTAGVVAEFRAIVAATRTSLLSIPHPVDMIPTEDELMRVAAKYIAEAIDEHMSGGNGVTAFAGSAKSEFMQRLEAFAEKYRAWWNESERKLHVATADLQSALLRVTLDDGPRQAPTLQMAHG